MAVERPEDDPAFLAELHRAVGDRLDAEQGLVARLRARSTASTIGLLALLGLGVPAGAAFSLGLSTSGSAAAVLLVLSFAGAAAALVVALRPLHRPPLPRGVVVALPALALALPVGLAAFGSDEPGVGTLGCLWAGLLVSAPSLALLLVSARSPRSLLGAATAGLAAGTAGYFAMGLHCPHTGRVHWLVAHVAIVVVAALVAAGLAWVAQRSRRVP